MYSGHVFIPRLADDQSSQVDLRQMTFKRTPVTKYEFKVVWKDTSTDAPTVSDQIDSYLLRVETPATLEEEW